MTYLIEYLFSVHKIQNPLKIVIHIIILSQIGHRTVNSFIVKYIFTMLNILSNAYYTYLQQKKKLFFSPKVSRFYTKIKINSIIKDLQFGKNNYEVDQDMKLNGMNLKIIANQSIQIIINRCICIIYTSDTVLSVIQQV